MTVRIPVDGGPVATYAVFIKGALDLTTPPGGDDDGSPFDQLDGLG